MLVTLLILIEELSLPPLKEKEGRNRTPETIWSWPDMVPGQGAISIKGSTQLDYPQILNTGGSAIAYRAIREWKEACHG